MQKRKYYKFIVVFTISLIFVVLIYNLLINILRNYIFPLKYFDIIKEEAINNNIDPYLILAIIKVESNFDKNITSVKEAKGLMQIMDKTANDVLKNSSEELDLYNEYLNIEIGCKYFRSLISRYNGNYYLAICAYNAGLGKVDKWIQTGLIDYRLESYKNNNIPYKETKNYLKKVILSYNIYRFLY